MGNVHTFNYHYKSNYGGFSSALGGETNDLITSATYVDMKNYDLVIGVCTASGVVSAQTLTLQMWQATNTAGGASKTVTGATDTYLSVATASTDVLVAQVRGEDLDVAGGFRYVGWKLTTNDTDGAEKVAGVTLQGRARYKQATLPA